LGISQKSTRNQWARIARKGPSRQRSLTGPPESYPSATEIRHCFDPPLNCRRSAHLAADHGGSGLTGHGSHGSRVSRSGLTCQRLQGSPTTTTSNPPKKQTPVGRIFPSSPALDPAPIDATPDSHLSLSATRSLFLSLPISQFSLISLSVSLSFSLYLVVYRNEEGRRKKKEEGISELYTWLMTIIMTEDQL
jgi:hypothetical protein